MLRTRFRTRARFIPALSGGGGFSITNSLRFNDNDSAYLSRTPSVAGDRKTWTWSGWVKRGNLGVLSTLFGSFVGYNDSQATAIIINSSNQIVVSPWTNIWFSSSAVLRDTSGWYHIVVVLDSTEATATDRIKVYINGVNQSGTYPLAVTLNADYGINQAGDHRLGDFPASGYSTFDGYMAEVNFIDGQALTADDFGEINADTGEWSPKKYSGTYGTNGFYLPFNGNANDDSGNGNNWTENNLASTDYMIDTPTNNFATLNPLNDNGSNTQSEGNLKYTQTSATTYTTTTSTMKLGGKHYWEVYVNGNTDYSLLGIFGEGALPSAGGVGANQAGGKSYGYSFNYLRTSLLNNNTAVVTGLNAYNNTDVVSFCFDADTNKFWYAINGAWQQSGDPAAGTNPLITVNDDSYAPCLSSLDSSCVFNFGQDSSFAGNKTRQGNTDTNGKGDFYYTPPTGYLALCTDNLPEPTIVDSESHFNVVTYTGTGTTLNVTGVGFQPDLVWMKRRDSANTHDLIDVVRGDTARLFPNLTDAELSDVTFSFDSDGFSPDPTKANENAAGGSYVAWCWKAGGTAVTNTDGTITSQVSANVDAGFSVVGYTGNGSSGATVGHGLSDIPEMVIIKSRGNSSDWPVWHTSLTPTTGTLWLNLTVSQSTYQNRFDSTGMSSSVFKFGTTIGEQNTSGRTYIAYCFHSVEGFSKFGSYVGNGSADGPFVYTGFRPAFVMIKRTDSAGNAWYIWDNELNPYNADGDNNLWANNNNAENTNDYAFDGLSDGFKIRATTTNLNASAGTYIYMAFAEAPFKNSVAR